MKFETILDMYDMANNGTWMEGDDAAYKKRCRQRDAFRARLIAMYTQEFTGNHCGLRPGPCPKCGGVIDHTIEGNREGLAWCELEPDFSDSYP